ncbi:MAG: YihY/virulence factor BrkB family protein [Actinomycetota bacterium]
MERAIITAGKFIKTAHVQWVRGDPLLMGAAIAYNSLFALVPLAIAFVSLVNLFDLSRSIAARLVDLIESTLPPDIAGFLVDIFESSTAVVGGDNTVVLVISILVALWSGSRAVYAVQKSLRLVQAVPDDRGYIRARSVGILVTFGAGASVMIGYSLLLFGESMWSGITDALGLGSVSMAQWSLSLLMAVWIYGMLWAVYRFGPPNPVEHTALVAAIAEGILVAGSWVAFTLLPSDTRSAAAAFGVLGVILVLLYFVGVTIVAVPIGVTSAWSAWSATRELYASEDEVESVEPEGSPQRSEPPRETSQ